MKKLAGALENILKNENVRKRISFIILWAYLWIVLLFQTIKNGNNMTVRFSAFLFLLSAGMALLVLCLIGKLLNFDTESPNPSKKIFLFAGIIFLITFAFYMMYFGAQYPGGMSPDTIDQYRQALSGDYNDWHPVLHTVLFFTLPLMTGHRLGFIVFLQLIYFCMAFTYLTCVLYHNGCPKILLGVICVYVWINPYLATYLMYPWKDIAFMIFAILLVAYYIQVICSKGEWLNKKKNVFAFSLVTVLCMYMRHNAILFVAPLIIIVFTHGTKKKTTRILMGVLMVVFLFSVQGVYKYLDVSAPGNRTVETVGLPMTIICNVMQKEPDALPIDTQEVMYTLATKEAYEEKYSAGNFNSIKHSGEFDSSQLNKLSYQEILKYTWECFRNAPKESFEALAKLTSLVWDLDGADSPQKVSVNDNDWNIKADPKFGSTFFNQIKSLLAVGGGKVIFGSIGFVNLTLLAVGLVMFGRGKVSIIHYLPLFCYNFGTMLLLSGRDYRFFLLNLPLWLPIIFLMYKENTEITQSSKFSQVQS